MSRARPSRTVDLRARNADDEVRVIHAEEAFRGAMVLDARNDTVIAALCGPKAASWCFLWFYRYLHLDAVSVVLWLVAHIVTVLSLCGVLPKVAVWVSLAGWGAIAQNALYWNRHILRKLATNFEVWYLLFLDTAWAVAVADAFGYDERLVWVVFLWASIVLIILFDAAPAMTRRLIAIGLAFGCGLFIFIMAAMHVGMFVDLKVRTVAVGSMLGIVSKAGDGDNADAASAQMTMTLNNVFFANQRLLIMWVFFVKNMVIYFRHPNCFVMVKARVKQEKMKVAAVAALLPPGRRLSVMPTVSALHSGGGSAAPARNVMEKVCEREASDAAASTTQVEQAAGEISTLRARVAELERQLLAERGE